VITVGDGKSEQVGPLSRRFLSADEWENSLIVECAVDEICGEECVEVEC
jgi:hypothetical protein